MKGKAPEVLEKVMEKVIPGKEELAEIAEKCKAFVMHLKKQAKAKKINVEIFVGGSFAKGTIIKKENYDIDIFARFDRKLKEKNISELAKKMLAGTKDAQEVHGSRNYFRIKSGKNIFIEVVPVLKVKKPEEAENITDLSSFHVTYIGKKLKSQKIINDVRIAKAFCHANNCYGAESYIRGFSGYGLELLVYHYNGFLNFIKASAKMKKGEKTVIDIEKQYKGKAQVLMDINAAKLSSPIILVDPTYRQRNVLSALSEETFEKFRTACIKFLKNPSENAFEQKKLDLDSVRKSVVAKNLDFIALKATTGKQEGDIAGTKLAKFFRHLKGELESQFIIKDSGEEYSGKKTSVYYFAAIPKKEIIKKGPETKDQKNANAFRKMHKHVFIKNKRLYAKDKAMHSVKDFLNLWEQKNKKVLEDMSIKELRVIG